jgi:carbonic anhydrase/acetyltransferase-like protein (isoleucine patch superfamily)
MRILLIRAISLLEYTMIYSIGRVVGISFVVRYLRNPNPRVTGKLLRAFGATVGDDTTIKRGVVLDNVYEDMESVGDLSHLKIGSNCYIGDLCFFDLAGEIVIDDNAVIAAGASFLTHAECGRSPYVSSRFPRSSGPVTIGGGAWIGYGATVFPGVTIGFDTVIGAGSLVLEDADPRSVYAGTPAKKLKLLT